MKRVRITVVKKTRYADLIGEYENPMDEECAAKIGDSFVSTGDIPEGFCPSAWESVGPFVRILAEGKKIPFDNWMKNPESAMVSCNDGFRPVSFLIEVI